jgi:hypothetical protein
MVILHMRDGRWVVGFDANNLRLMQAGKPMVIDFAKYGGEGMLYLMYGDTVEAITADLQRLTGGRLPPIEDLRGLQ